MSTYLAAGAIGICAYALNYQILRSKEAKCCRYARSRDLVELFFARVDLNLAKSTLSSYPGFSAEEHFQIFEAAIDDFEKGCEYRARVQKQNSKMRLLVLNPLIFYLFARSVFRKERFFPEDVRDRNCEKCLFRRMAKHRHDLIYGRQHALLEETRDLRPPAHRPFSL